MYDKKWNGKGYDENGNIIYELIKGNGKVREYDYKNEYLKFEGEYLNGKKEGKGKQYWENGKLRFEGEYSNGERNGKGKLYFYNGELEFEGEFLKGKKWKGKKFKGKWTYFYYYSLFKNHLNEKDWDSIYYYFENDLFYDDVVYINGERRTVDNNEL